MVRERGQALAAKVAERPDDPFDVALLTDADLDDDPARLVDELMAYSLMGGRRLVRLRLSSERAGPDRLAAEALERHAAGDFNPDAFFLIEAGNLGPQLGAAPRRREAGRRGRHPLLRGRGRRPRPPHPRGAGQGQGLR